MSTNAIEEALTARLQEATVAAFDLASVYLGVQLGYYAGLRELGNANPAELARAVDANVRYTREWLEQQAVSGLISVWEQSASPDGRRYALTPGTEDLLTDSTGDISAIHDLQCAMSTLLVANDVVQCYRDGTGLPFSRYGEPMRRGQELGTRRGFVHDLATVWMPTLPDIHQRLLTTPGRRIADIGFGAGWSSIALARAYPDAIVDGLDLDPESVDLAQRNAAAEGLSDRITFRVQDAADPALAGHYDLVCAFECIHDMTQPVPVLRAMRNLLAPDGAVLIGDSLVAEEFTAPGDLSERSTYGYSLFHCLPVGMDSTIAVGTGAVMRQSTFRSYASAAGFSRVDVLPIDKADWQFYRLTR